MKKRIPTILLILVFMAGLSLLLYPSVANYYNALHATKAVSAYKEQVDDLNEKKYEEIYTKAVKYNQKLATKGGACQLSEEDRREYNATLNIENGMMGYVEIEKLRVSLPIYHGTADEILQVAAGHLEWTSLPVGGKSSHCVLSGHRGLPSAKLFTDLDQLQEGDTFTLHILNEVLTYEVDQIRIVQPEDTQDLVIEPGKDYCTLVTCTPYGINTHRLLVRGHRVATVDTERVVSEAIVIEPIIVAPVLAIPILLMLLLSVLLRGRKEKFGKNGETDHE